jgi:hypothetical protein
MQSDSFYFCISFVCSLHGLAKMKALQLSCKPLIPWYSLPQTLIHIQRFNYSIIDLKFHHSVHKSKLPKRSLLVKYLSWDQFYDYPSINASFYMGFATPHMLHAMPNSSFDRLNSDSDKYKLLVFSYLVFPGSLLLILIQNNKLWDYGNTGRQYSVQKVWNQWEFQLFSFTG